MSKSVGIAKSMAYAMKHYSASECCFKFCKVCNHITLFHLTRCLNHDCPDTPSAEQYINKYKR